MAGSVGLPAIDVIPCGIREAPTIWKVSLEGTGDNPTRTECLKNNHIRIGWDNYGKDITDETDFSVSGGRVVLNAFINKMQVGDIVLSCYSASTIDAIGMVAGEYEWHDEYPSLKRLRKGEIFQNSIIPLLQEYFYEDYEKIRLVLGDNKKTDMDRQFIVAKSVSYASCLAMQKLIWMRCQVLKLTEPRFLIWKAIDPSKRKGAAE